MQTCMLKHIFLNLNHLCLTLEVEYCLFVLEDLPVLHGVILDCLCVQEGVHASGSLPVVHQVHVSSETAIIGSGWLVSPVAVIIYEEAGKLQLVGQHIVEEIQNKYRAKERRLVRKSANCL